MMVRGTPDVSVPETGILLSVPEVLSELVVMATLSLSSRGELPFAVTGLKSIGRVQDASRVSDVVAVHAPVAEEASGKSVG